MLTYYKKYLEPQKHHNLSLLSFHEIMTLAKLEIYTF